MKTAHYYYSYYCYFYYCYCYFYYYCYYYQSFCVSLQTNKDISVTVKDINDNPPVFAQGGSSSFNIAEVGILNTLVEYSLDV